MVLLIETKLHQFSKFDRIVNLNSRQNQKLRQFICQLISYEIPDESSQYMIMKKKTIQWHLHLIGIPLC